MAIFEDALSALEEGLGGPHLSGALEDGLSGPREDGINGPPEDSLSGPPEDGLKGVPEDSLSDGLKGVPLSKALDIRNQSVNTMPDFQLNVKWGRHLWDSNQILYFSSTARANKKK